MKTPRTNPTLSTKFNNEGHCRGCNKELTGRQRRWCSLKCRIDHDIARGFYVRYHTLKASKNDKGRLICGMCGKEVKDYGEVEDDPDLACVDHKVPLALGGTNDPTNLWVLCNICHKAKTKRDIKNMANARKTREFIRKYGAGLRTYGV